MDINIPEVMAEVEAGFARYEAALVGNDLEALDALFWEARTRSAMAAPRTSTAMARSQPFAPAATRWGSHDGWSTRSSPPTAGDFATASTLFRRDAAAGKIGRQMQTWVRLPEGWRVVAAHVSLIAEPVPTA